MPLTTAEIARRALADHLAALPAADLLARYATRHDPEAFAGLVRQFGPLVLGVCRRVGVALDSTDDTLAAVDDPLAGLLRGYREAEKRSGTYGRKWLTKHAQRGIVRPSWRQLGAGSGRMSSDSSRLRARALGQ
jgi:hypothetical protein